MVDGDLQEFAEEHHHLYLRKTKTSNQSLIFKKTKIRVLIFHQMCLKEVAFYDNVGEIGLFDFLGGDNGVFSESRIFAVFVILV